MKWFFATVFVLLLLLILAIYKAPASLVPLAIQEAETRGLLQQHAPRLILAETSGTVWQGEAAKAQLLIDGAILELGRLSWQLDALSLLEKKPLLQLFTNASTHKMQARISATEQGEVTINAMEGRLPISLLEPWFPMLVKGDIAFVIDHVIFNPQQLLALDGVLNFEYVDWLGGEYDMPLGSYLAQLSLDEKNDIQIQLNDYGATLGIDGMLSISPTGNYHFNASLQPQDGLAPEVAQSITWFGKKNAQGEILINRRGRL